MKRKFKVYKEHINRMVPVYETDSYAEACRKEEELKKEGHKVFVWEC